MSGGKLIQIQKSELTQKFKGGGAYGMNEFKHEDHTGKLIIRLNQTTLRVKDFTNKMIY